MGRHIWGPEHNTQQHTHTSQPSPHATMRTLVALLLITGLVAGAPKLDLDFIEDLKEQLGDKWDHLVSTIENDLHKEWHEYEDSFKQVSDVLMRLESYCKDCLDNDDCEKITKEKCHELNARFVSGAKYFNCMADKKQESCVMADVVSDKQEAEHNQQEEKENPKQEKQDHQEEKESPKQEEHDHQEEKESSKHEEHDQQEEKESAKHEEHDQQEEEESSKQEESKSKQDKIASLLKELVKRISRK